MITTVLIDDEPIALKYLSELIQKYCPQLRVEGVASSIEQGIALLAQLKPELVFLDIELSGQNSFELLHQTRSLDFEKIFVTAHEKFGVQAIKHNASDYVLKPINKKELIDAVEKTAAKIYTKRMVATQHHLEKMHQGLHSNRITLPCIDGLIFVELDKIMYCESEGRYTRFYMTDTEKKLMVSKNIGEYETTLVRQHSFVRIHSHYIVNLDYVVKYVKGRGGYVVLNNGKTLEVSVRKKDDFLRKLESY